VLVRHGKGGRLHEVGMDRWGWDHLRPWLEIRISDAGRPAAVRDRGCDPRAAWASEAARAQVRRVASKAGVGRRFAPHQLRHAHDVELAHEGVPLNVIQRQPGPTNLGVTSIYLQGIDNAEIIPGADVRVERRGCRSRTASSTQPWRRSWCPG
jgi:integrase